MKKLLSLPPNLVECFYDIEKADRKEWFCTSDPIGSKLGSGGGTAWLLQACKTNENNEEALTDWLAKENVSCCMQEDRAAVCRDMLLPERY